MKMSSIIVPQGMRRVLLHAVDDSVSLLERVSAVGESEYELLQSFPIKHKGFEKRADVIDFDTVGVRAVL